MQTFPLLPLPEPRAVAVPKTAGGGFGKKARFPAREAQVERFAPMFERLARVLDGDPLELRDDPAGLSPDRVIVFELAESVADFARAVARVPGLEFLGEQEFEFAADERFSALDGSGLPRPGKSVTGRIYLAVPDIEALRELCSLWQRWRDGEPMHHGFAQFQNLFEQLRDVRTWGPKDRISEEAVEDWKVQLAEAPDAPIRLEVELWFHSKPEKRQLAVEQVRNLVLACSGRVLDHSCIGEIEYHGMLVELPAIEVEGLIAARAVELAASDEIMYLRPQSVMEAVLPLEDVEFRGGDPAAAVPPGRVRPIAALFDGVPLQRHAWLDGRLTLDDPDGLETRALVERREHGTAMASLIVHGDRNETSAPIGRPLYVRPVLVPRPVGVECFDGNRLLVDTVHRAVLRMKGSGDEIGVAPTVFLINLSLGIRGRPFAGLMSPLARLVDFLADRYNLLFLVSAGNVLQPLEIPDYTWSQLKSESAETRERAVLGAVSRDRAERTILSPAESINALTIGALHRDSLEERRIGYLALDPFETDTLPNVSSGLGLGYRRMVKPDLFFPGGREHIQMMSSGAALVVQASNPARAYGLRSAAPDGENRGRLDGEALSGGTSGATALATRAAHRIFEFMTDRDGGARLSDLDPQFYAVVVKALLVHRASWGEESRMLREVCGPNNSRQHVERKENVARFVGFGAPAVEDVLECGENRATLVGWGTLNPGTAHEFRVPLPPCLELIKDPRSVTITNGWITPVRCGGQRYRGVSFEAEPPNKLDDVLGVRRQPDQPGDDTVGRGTVFHERYRGKAAVKFVDDGMLVLHVRCKQDAGIEATDAVRYGIVVTIETEAKLPVYEQIRNLLLVQVRN